MAKRLFIVHGWGYGPGMFWYPWLSERAKEKGFSVTVPEMPGTDSPEIGGWVARLKQAVGQLDSNTYFVGHSIGCQAIMRLLAGSTFKGRTGSVVFVAGWFRLANLESDEVREIARPWTETPIDFKDVARRVGSLTVFLSDDDPYGFVDENSKLFMEKLGAKVVVERGRGHFTDGITEMPEVLEELLTVG